MSKVQDIQNYVGLYNIYEKTIIVKLYVISYKLNIFDKMIRPANDNIRFYINILHLDSIGKYLFITSVVPEI